MAEDSKDTSMEDLVQQGDDERKALYEEDEFDPVILVERVYQLWWRWADFHLFIISPTIDTISPPLIIPPAVIDDSGELEFVYTIYDHGYKLSTSKGEEMLTIGMSMYKLYLTIEKMIYLLVERLKSGGIDTETEVQIAFGGHELAQRKAFESVINLNYNVVVTNFDPGVWGERYLQNVKRLADKGYGYPPEAPRDTYRHPHTSTAATTKRS
ncbi:virulence factor [Legionella nagasakiensis]|uniref:virulence factor n=1 Tax=Legionella nagasakiensis TaxID=535290 RepID=UPI0010549DE0|nr:virulence factor [Legionella nagasakiensis]